MSTDQIDRTLRAIDQDRQAASALTARAEDDLQRILAQDRDVPARTPSPAGRRPRPRRVLIALAVPALAAIGVTAALLTGVRHQPAMATWTASGSPVAADHPGVEQCVRWWQVESADTVPVLQEQRGITTLVVGADSEGREIICTATARDGQESIGGHTSLLEAPAAGLAPTSVEVQTVDTSFESAEAQNGWKAQGHTVAAGHVGTSVTALVLETPAGPVEATISDGRFAAWWPIGDETDAHPQVTAVATLADGTEQNVELHAS